uniref:hypothetical protein n=1 Tax=Eggerthella sinensis TaxID=242230 RepID=UPI0022E8E02C
RRHFRRRAVRLRRAAWSASASDIGAWVGTRVEGSSLVPFVDEAKAKPALLALVPFVDEAKAKPALLAHVAQVSKGDPIHATSRQTAPT